MVAPLGTYDRAGSESRHDRTGPRFGRRRRRPRVLPRPDRGTPGRRAGWRTSPQPSTTMSSRRRRCSSGANTGRWSAPRRTSSSRRSATRSRSTTTPRSCAPAPPAPSPGALTEIETVDAGASALLRRRPHRTRRRGWRRQRALARRGDRRSERATARARRARSSRCRPRSSPTIVRCARVAELTNPFATRPTDWYAAVARRGPLLVRSVRSPQLPRIAITTAAPSAKVAPRWGDWHFGADLARALRRPGHEVGCRPRIRATPHASRSCDIHLVLHGLATRRPDRGPAPRVVGHQPSRDARAPRRWTRPISCSSRPSSSPASSGPGHARPSKTSCRRPITIASTPPVDPRFAHPVVVVAKTRTRHATDRRRRDRGRASARRSTGPDGRSSSTRACRRAVRRQRGPAARVRVGRRRAQRPLGRRCAQYGFVSNRIFDVLACGTPVISDHLPEIADLFGDTVPTYRRSDDLAGPGQATFWTIRAAARARAEAGRARVLAAHTFDHRAGRDRRCDLPSPIVHRPVTPGSPSPDRPGRRGGTVTTGSVAEGWRRSGTIEQCGQRSRAKTRTGHSDRVPRTVRGIHRG